MRYLIPIAASDDLFPREEFHFPKPLIEIDAVPMISRVIDNIKGHDQDADFIFVARAQDCREFSLDRSLHVATDGRCKIVALEHTTAGAACSCLLAIDHIDDGQALVVCNGDQIIEWGLADALSAFARDQVAAGVITFPSVHPRWSYVRLDDQGSVVEAAEKSVISRRAIAGFYYFASGSAFVRAAKQSILNARSFKGRYFIAPLLNELILDGEKVAHFDIDAEDYQSLYSPQRLDSYERQIQNLRSNRARPTHEGNVTVVIPMAGRGSRFAQAGYAKPKPFIDVGGKTMIERVMDNLSISGARFVLVAHRDVLEAEPGAVSALLARGDVQFAPIDLVTEGAACTVLTARSHWNPEEALLIANCDQIVDFDCRNYIEDARARNLDGSILTFQDPTRDLKWSFARTSSEGLVLEVREKVAISETATVGLYYFSKAKFFTEAAIDMISRNERVNGEFYVCPAYNHAIQGGARIGVYDVPAVAMHGIGTPDDLTAFLSLRYPG